jgi:hypothetical protein
MMPLINPMAKPPEKTKKGKEALAALKLMGVKEQKDG